MVSPKIELPLGHTLMTTLIAKEDNKFYKEIYLLITNSSVMTGVFSLDFLT
jgi:hypothetical protein